MRGKPTLIIIALLATAPVLAACDSFDMDKLDVFKLNEKKKLPGDRKALFPEGVPGVSQGIPPDLVKGYQPPPQPAEAKVAEPEPVKERPKPRTVKRAAKTQITVQPTTQQTQPQQTQPQQQQAQQPAWPEPKPQPTGTQAPWPATTQQQPSPWPAAPAPNTFQR